MILGIGLDLENIDRIAAATERWGERFTRRVFTEGERAFARARANGARHLAARFAAKEAILKALKVPPGLSWQDMEITGGGKQAPEIVLSGRAKEAADEMGVARLHLTLTHTRDTAAAVVIAEGH